MRTVLISTDRPDFHHLLVRGEIPPHGVVVPEGGTPHPDGTQHFTLKVNLKVISSTAFAMWLLRKIRSIPGHHRLEIGGAVMSQQMPEAIDLIADAVVNAKRLARLAA